MWTAALLAAGAAVVTGPAGPVVAQEHLTPVAAQVVGNRAAPGRQDAAVPYRPPVAGTPAFARGFQAPAERWSAGHRGLDLWLEAGAEVVSPAPGMVTFAGTVVDRGVVSVLHPDGRRTSLEPVSAAVVVGQQVQAGTPLGTLQEGGTHCAPRACLHWGLREGDRYVDPMTMLPGGGPVVLLPLDGAG